MSALMQAIIQRRWRQAKLLVETGCNINGRGPNGRTPLMEICFVDDEDKAAGLARLLLEKGANLDSKDNEGRTALANACLLHRRQLFALFIKLVDFDLNAPNDEGNTALFHAITAGDVHVVKVLVAKMVHFGVHVDALNKKGETPLIYALKSKKREIADVLVRQGKASLEARDLEFHKSASEWKNELQTKKRKGLRIPSVNLKKYGTQKDTSQIKISKKAKTTGSAKVGGIDRREPLPNISMAKRPVTAPDRIIVPSFFKPCTPVKNKLGKLYMIYNQQTTDSYRKGYKTVRQHKESVRQETKDEQDSNRTGVSFGQVNELSIKLQGLYKNTAYKRTAMVSENPGLPRIDSDNSLTGRSSSRSSKKGCKMIKNITKTVHQFHNVRFSREISSGSEFTNSLKCAVQD